jgi:phosphoribosylglycinamide formyltransferase-1
VNRQENKPPLRIVVLISGGGTTLKNLLAKKSAGELDTEIKLVVSSNAKARGLEIASAAGIANMVLRAKDFATPLAYSDAIFSACRDQDVDYVVMGGFLSYVPIPPDFENRVLNIHPALIPAFCGKGFYGHHVHEAVLEYGVKISGCTVHFVDNQYDHGPVVLQRTVPVLDDDTPDTLAARVFEAECEAYPEALRLLGSGSVTMEGRRVRVQRS